MTKPSIDFWFSVGSTYAYLSIMRLKDVEREIGVQFEWRPFSVRKIMLEMNNIPFSEKPVKAAYMWRDIERRSQAYDLPVRVPAPYPLQDFDLANKVAIVGRAEGWCADYVIATYKRWFQQGLPAGSEPNISASLTEIGQDPVRVIHKADDGMTRNAYFAATDEARDLGVFGAPTFVVGREVFWGDDRLEDAVFWHRKHADAD
ncbi:MAG: 2-hydroxychromene-2-carboxylate isomerase [Hyphomicrobiales bacterium]|nr:2-hydroxychromene-2-carboxylate isomerase [Hyphomicrobiales bacterium]MCP4998045.1 2-hydroxychromene-2-carboxylate isomerase [Hyphomicrobiales bacterium]